MPKRIKFIGDGDREWEGPFEAEVALYKKHVHTTRYRGTLAKGAPFDLYVPLLMLDGAAVDILPKVLGVRIDRSRSPMMDIGLRGEWRPLTAEPGVWEYAFVANKTRWKLYQFKRDKYPFSVYVPNEVFGDKPHPSRIFVRIFEQ